MNNEMEAVESTNNTAPASDKFMLGRANDHIKKLECELKQKTIELDEVTSKMLYFKQVLIKIIEL
ncbi:hypothetical protein JLT2_7 [Paraglaciecola Antarctic JLT virus 2]|nr:hypothetical protein JLT2_7 [Paraglaciecola Antarctic JLT virus 2]